MKKIILISIISICLTSFGYAENYKNNTPTTHRFGVGIGNVSDEPFTNTEFRAVSFDDVKVATEYIGPISTAPTVTVEADKQATSQTSYTFEFSVETGRNAVTVVSSGGFTVTCDDGDCTDDETETGIVLGVTSPTSDTLTVTDSSGESDSATINITLPSTGNTTTMSATGTPRTCRGVGTPFTVGQ